MVVVQMPKSVRANIAIVSLLGYSNRHGLKSRDWKRPLSKAGNSHNRYYGTYIQIPGRGCLNLKIPILSVLYITKLQNEIKIDRLTSSAYSHAIESRFDIRRKFAFEAREIEITMKIGENRALGRSLAIQSGVSQGKTTGCGV
jgi:hypothetical protein